MNRKLGVMMQKENDFGMRLMRSDLWNGLRKRHKAYRHPAKVGCNTYERAFKKEYKLNIYNYMKSLDLYNVQIK